MRRDSDQSIRADDLPRITDSKIVLPHVDSVVIGGTQQRGDERSGLDAADSARIWDAVVIAPVARGQKFSGSSPQACCTLRSTAPNRSSSSGTCCPVNVSSNSVPTVAGRK